MCTITDFLSNLYLDKTLYSRDLDVYLTMNVVLALQSELERGNENISWLYVSFVF